MASIICGNCGQTHTSAAEVKLCYNGEKVESVARPSRPPTGPMIKLLAELRTERGLVTDGIGAMEFQAVREEIRSHLSPKGKAARLAYEQKTKPRTGYDDPWQSEAPSRAQDLEFKRQYAEREREQERAAYAAKMHRDEALLSGQIYRPDEMTHEEWIAKVRADRAALRQDATAAQATVYSPNREKRLAWPRFEDIPAGHYAFPSLTGNNDLDFARVDRPTEGPYRGRYFVKRVIGGRPDQSIRGREVLRVMEAIRAEGPDKAALRYGQEIGRCYKCNRSLTDETSRAMGIGPDCRSRL